MNVHPITDWSALEFIYEEYNFLLIGMYSLYYGDCMQRFVFFLLIFTLNGFVIEQVLLKCYLVDNIQVNSFIVFQLDVNRIWLGC